MPSYRLAIETTIDKDLFVVHCPAVRASASGETKEEALTNLRETILEMVDAFGAERVFADVNPNSQCELMEIASNESPSGAQ
jgi:predicted RNase H-like HicB family nuclease